MECALAAIGKQWARQDRKRRRDAASGESDAPKSFVSTSGSAEQSSPAELQAERPQQPAMHPALLAMGVQKRLHDSVRSLIDEGSDRKLKAGAAFVSRSVYAVFMALQAVHPLPHGPQWASLLFICYQAVCKEFFGIASMHRPTNTRPEPLTVRELRTLVRKLGMLPNTRGEDEALMKAARVWERASDDELSVEIAAVWKILSDVPRVSAVFASMLWPCQRAHLLFDHNTNNTR